MFGQLVSESTLPVRKRRRPALSCVECRRRKIKCDRNDPCSHCKSSKITNCVYNDTHPPWARHSSTALAAAPLSHTEQGRQSDGYQMLSQDSSLISTPVTPDISHSEKDASSISSPQARHADEHVQGLIDRVTKSETTLPDAMAYSGEDKTSMGLTHLGVDFTTFNDVLVQDGTTQGRIRTKYFSVKVLKPNDGLRGSYSKTRFFGQSHWMNFFDQFPQICSFRDRNLNATAEPGVDEAQLEIRTVLEKCKNIARKVKVERLSQWHMNPDFKNYFPLREMSDKLVGFYLRTMESTHRILHIPSFQREYEEYWIDPQAAPSCTVVKILLVMAIGTCFYQGPDNDSLRAQAQQWVYSAQSWASAPFEKGRLNLAGLQVHCLLLLARQTNAVGGDLIWIAAGSLLRTAFQMGFHRDPKFFPKMSILHCELRRRLWATVLEITIQTSLDSGMPPLITIHDFDTEPPLNINDVDICENTTIPPTPKPESEFTQTSIQIQLLKSIKTRHEISRMVNDFHTEPTYDEILRLGSELTNACNESSRLMLSYNSPPPIDSPHLLEEMHARRPTPLGRNLLDMFQRSFLLAIHRPFTMKSQQNPRFYYSRKVCLDTALLIMSKEGVDEWFPRPVDETGKELMDDYTRLKSVGGGFYKQVVIQAGMLICLELITQLGEEAQSGLPTSEQSRIVREPLRNCVKGLLDLTSVRIELGENNVKGHLVLSAAMGQIDALENKSRGGEGSPERGIVEAARVSARHCSELLKKRTKGQRVQTPSDERGEMVGRAEAGQEPLGYGIDVNMDFGYDFVMQDGSPNLNFDAPDSWLYSGWDENSMW